MKAQQILSGMSLFALLATVGASIWANEPQQEPLIHAVIDKIKADYLQAVKEADDDYEKRIEPYKQRRANIITAAGNSAVARLERAAADAQRIGSDFQAALARTEAENVKKLVEVTIARIPPEASQTPERGEDISLRAKFGGHSYLAILAPVTWHEAKKLCEKMGGYLACVETQEELMFVNTLIRGVIVWVGGTNERDHKTWLWLNGKTIDQSLWHRGHPERPATENYICTVSGKLTDEPANSRHTIGFLCEWDR